MTKSRLFIFLMALVALASCDKVYINGDLDGMWQLQRVETGDTTEYPQGIYYSFQRHMVQVGEYYENRLPERYIGNLDYKGGTLTISGLRKYLEVEKPCSATKLNALYLFSDSVTFTIEKLNKEILVMKNGEKRYLFEKW